MAPKQMFLLHFLILNWFKGLTFLADGAKAVVQDHVTELVQQVVGSDLNEENKNSATSDPPCKKRH